MTVRLHQIESTLKRALSEVLARGLSDPRITGLISVTRVTVSPDLHDAYVYISVMPRKNERKVLAGLRHGVRHIHSQVRGLVSMRHVPQFDLRLDAGLKKQADVLDAIRRGMERERPQDPDAGDAPCAPDSSSDRKSDSSNSSSAQESSL